MIHNITTALKTLDQTHLTSETISMPEFKSRNPKKVKLSKSKKAGLTISTSRVEKSLRKMRLGKRVSKGAPVYLTSVLEYLTAEILELSGNAARDFKVKRITPRHIVLAIYNDQDLAKFIGKHVTISRGGVLPHIHKSLVPEKKSKKKKALHSDFEASTQQDESIDKSNDEVAEDTTNPEDARVDQEEDSY